MAAVSVTVWHGTDAEPFERFDPARIGDWKFGFWFAVERGTAEMFGANAAECRISLDRPYTITHARWNAIRDAHARDAGWFAAWRGRLVEAGHDGLHVLGDVFRTSRGLEFKDPEVYAVFDASRIEILEWHAAPTPGPR